MHKNSEEFFVEALFLLSLRPEEQYKLRSYFDCNEAYAKDVRFSAATVIPTSWISEDIPQWDTGSQ